MHCKLTVLFRARSTCTSTGVDVTPPTTVPLTAAIGQDGSAGAFFAQKHTVLKTQLLLSTHVNVVKMTSIWLVVFAGGSPVLMESSGVPVSSTAGSVSTQKHIPQTQKSAWRPRTSRTRAGRG